jgi:hypothetical protein
VPPPKPVVEKDLAKAKAAAKAARREARQKAALEAVHGPAEPPRATPKYLKILLQYVSILLMGCPPGKSKPRWKPMERTVFKELFVLGLFCREVTPWKLPLPRLRAASAFLRKHVLPLVSSAESWTLAPGRVLLRWVLTFDAVATISMDYYVQVGFTQVLPNPVHPWPPLIYMTLDIDIDIDIELTHTPHIPLFPACSYEIDSKH